MGSIEIKQVRRSGDEALFNSLIEQHHYLDYEQPVGEHLNYVVWGPRPASVGLEKRGGATSDSLPTTRGF